MRALVDIPEGNIEALAAICAQANISRAESIRRAIDLFIQSYAATPSVDAFGAWKNQALDGVAYQDSLRAEW